MRRRTLMAESDGLLDDVERLRLDDQSEVPQQLREAICALQVRLGRTDPPLAPATLHAAHDLVFAVQQRLMAANPKHPRPNRPARRPGGQPVMTIVRDGGLWKLLTLPPPGGTSDDEWLELVECTVERAAQERYKPHVALAVARTAWSNYWELYVEAEEIRARVSAATSSRPPKIPPAPHA